MMPFASPEADDFVLIEATMQAFLADFDTSDTTVAIPSIPIDSPRARCDYSSFNQNTMAISTNVRRQRQRDKVNQLRNLERRLSIKLDQIKDAYQTSLKAKKKPCANGPRGKKQATQSVDAMMLWKQIAERQFLLREKSETENAKLRKALKYHFRRARSYQRTLQMRLPEAMMGASMDLIREHENGP